jgi:hypothetical protein
MNAARTFLRRFLRVVPAVLGLLLVSLVSGTSARAQESATTLLVSNPVCVQVASVPGVCQINLRSIAASGSGGSLLGVTVGISGKLRARFNTFFENDVNMTASMLGGGFRVTCGLPGSGGLSGLGRVYSVTISTVVSSGSSLTDTSNVACPAYKRMIYLPIIRR